MAFELIDIGKTGYIELAELERICSQLNMGFTKEEIEKMIYTLAELSSSTSLELKELEEKNNIYPNIFSSTKNNII